MELSDAKWDVEYDGEDFNVKVGNFNLVGCHWEPKVTPKYVYIFVHGLGVFSTFKKDFFHLILEDGGAVYACDHIGHGRSEGSRVSCKISENVEETKKVVELASQKYPSLPIFVHGHSMGGLTALALVFHNPNYCATNISGLIAEAPWISECPQRRVGCCMKTLVKVADKICPNIAIPGGVRMFSDDTDQTWVNMVKNHPTCYDVVTPRLYASVDYETEFVRGNRNMYPLKLPLLFLQGKKDDLVDAEQSDVWVRSLIKEHPKADITYKLYEDGPHVLLKSKYRPEVAKEIIGFIHAHMRE